MCVQKTTQKKGRREIKRETTSKHVRVIKAITKANLNILNFNQTANSVTTDFGKILHTILWDIFRLISVKIKIGNDVTPITGGFTCLIFVVERSFVSGIFLVCEKQNGSNQQQIKTSTVNG